MSTTSNTLRTKFDAEAKKRADALSQAAGSHAAIVEKKRKAEEQQNAAAAALEAAAKQLRSIKESAEWKAAENDSTLRDAEADNILFRNARKYEAIYTTLADKQLAGLITAMPQTFVAGIVRTLAESGENPELFKALPKQDKDPGKVAKLTEKTFGPIYTALVQLHKVASN